MANGLNGAHLATGKSDGCKGLEYFDKVIAIDQSPIGRTPRSNPATYTGVFTMIRELFAATPDARERGYKAGRFSFNVSGGRCENCCGDGIKKIEMHFCRIFMFRVKCAAESGITVKHWKFAIRVKIYPKYWT